MIGASFLGAICSSCSCHVGDTYYVVSSAEASTIDQIRALFRSEKELSKEAKRTLAIKHVRIMTEDEKEEKQDGLKKGLEACKICCLAVLRSGSPQDYEARFITAQNRANVALDRQTGLKEKQRKNLVAQVKYINKFGSEAATLWNIMKADQKRRQRDGDDLDDFLKLFTIRSCGGINKKQYNMIVQRFRLMQEKDGIDEKDFFSRMFSGNNFAEIPPEFQDLFLSIAVKSSRLVPMPVIWTKPFEDTHTMRLSFVQPDDAYVDEGEASSSEQAREPLTVHDPIAEVALSSALKVILQQSNIWAPDMEQDFDAMHLMLLRTQMACELSHLDFNEVNKLSSIPQGTQDELVRGFEQLGKLDGTICQYAQMLSRGTVIPGERHQALVGAVSRNKTVLIELKAPSTRLVDLSSTALSICVQAAVRVKQKTPDERGGSVLPKPPSPKSGAIDWLVPINQMGKSRTRVTRDTATAMTAMPIDNASMVVDHITEDAFDLNVKNKRVEDRT